MCEGIAAELAGIDLGDRRLNQRSVEILEFLSAKPEASVNAAIERWGDTLAAYRLFRNERVRPEEILRPHREATERRMLEQSVVLLVQGTTEFDFTAHPPKDARCLDAEHRFGFYDHTHLAVTPARLCLGVVASEQFDRALETLGQGRARKSLSIEQKESFRWLAGYRLACECQQRCGETQVISVADCEADIYEILAEVEQQSPAADFIIRARENRELAQTLPPEKTMPETTCQGSHPKSQPWPKGSIPPQRLNSSYASRLRHGPGIREGSCPGRLRERIEGDFEGLRSVSL